MKSSPRNYAINHKVITISIDKAIVMSIMQRIGTFSMNETIRWCIMVYELHLIPYVEYTGHGKLSNCSVSGLHNYGSPMMRDIIWSMYKFVGGNRDIVNTANPKNSIIDRMDH